MTAGAEPDARPAGPVARTLDAAAGLLSAGLLVVGVVLLVAALVAPAAWPAVGWGPATGPGWPRVAAQLGVGVAGEAVVRFRRSWPDPARVGADLAVIAAVLLVLGWAWLP